MKKVLATGTFDILHIGHLDYLKRAKSFGDVLIVHVESDEAVKRHKGLERPINNERDRLRLIKALQIVDQAFVADGEKDWSSILFEYQPEVLIIAPKKDFDCKEKESQFKSVIPDLQIIWFEKTQDLQSSSEIIKTIKKDL